MFSATRVFTGSARSVSEDVPQLTPQPARSALSADPVAKVRRDHVSARLSMPGASRTRHFLNREPSGTPRYANWRSNLRCHPHAELYLLATDRQRKMSSASILLTSATSNPAAGCTTSVEHNLHGIRFLRPAYLHDRWSIDCINCRDCNHFAGHLDFRTQIRKVKAHACARKRRSVYRGMGL